MWYGNCDALFSSAIRDPDHFHVFPNSEDGRRTVQRISDTCHDSVVVLVGNCFYVALSQQGRDLLLDKMVLMLDRKVEKLHALQRDVDDLKECVEILGY